MNLIKETLDFLEIFTKFLPAFVIGKYPVTEKYLDIIRYQGRSSLRIDKAKALVAL